MVRREIGKYSDEFMNSKLIFLIVVLFLIDYHNDTSNLKELRESPNREDLNFRWQQTDVSLALLNHDRIVWQLNYDKNEGKPYFHPLSLVDGPDLTWLRPPDHPWHKALWFSWKYINGLNYWEEDRETGLSEGRTELVDVKVIPDNDYSARIEMTLSYHPPEKPCVLNEKRLITVSSPHKDSGYFIDWHSTFTACVDDVELNRTPIGGEKNGKSWGGYAGLSVRLAKNTSDWQIIDSEGRRDMKSHGESARWLDYCFQTETGGAAGIAILDHPANLRHPSPWYVTMNAKEPFCYFNPAVLFSEPYILSGGKSVMLRYRILIHTGLGDKNLLEKEWKGFR